MTDGYDINEICSLPQEQHQTAFELLNAGVTDGYDIREICSLPQEQHQTAVELVKAGMTDTYYIKKICSLPKEQQTRAIEFKKTCQNSGIDNIDYIDNKLADIASSEVKTYFLKECINKCLTYDDINLLSSLSEEQIPSAIKFIQEGYTDSYGISQLVKLPDNQKENALKIIQASDEKSDWVTLNKLSQEKYYSKTIDMIKRGANTDDIDSYFKILEDAHNNYEMLNYVHIIFIKAQFENLGTMEQEVSELNLITDYLYKTGSIEYKRYIDIIGNDVKNLRNTELQVIDIVSDDIKYKQIMSLKNKGFSTASAVNYNYIFNSGVNLNDLTSSEKISTFYELTEIKSELETKTGVEEELAKINSLLADLNKDLNQIIMPTDVTAEAQTAMMQGFFANNNTNLENTLATTDFSQFGKEGIPLEYSRTEFLSDLCKTLEGLSETNQADILKRLGITPAESGLENGYDGIINVNTENLELDLTNPVEAKVYELANKFIRENSVHTGDEALDEALNSLIQGMPEFINVIGKQQHATQELSVDAHILKVLQEAMSNENYQSLSSLDKTILKLSIVLHDIAKSEGVVDKEHPTVSALYARNILEKYSLPVSMRDRIFELIKNHHWLEGYNNGEINADYAATMFRHKDDYTIAKIMAESDLKGVSKSFYNAHKDALDNIDEIGNSQDKINQTGQIVFTSKIVKPDLIPTQEYNGQTYKVINFTELPEDFDLSQYGFTPDTTPNSLRLYVHMTESKTNLEKVFTLSDVAKGGFLCASYISLNNKSTYYDQRIGLSLEAENVNIANAARYNQGSGGQKDFASFSEIITGDTKNSGPYNLSKYRNTIPNTIKQELNLTDEEYKLFYEQFAKLQYETQIRDDKEYTIGSKTIMGADIKAAIRNANNNLFDKSKIKSHNESNLYNPKINAIVAKINSLEELAAEYPDILSFAQEHNLPIYLLGE